MSAQAATPSAASAAPPLALLCGASGFIGRHIACALDGSDGSFGVLHENDVCFLILDYLMGEVSL